MRSKFKGVKPTVADQIRWIDDHGGDLAGYVARYGAVGDPNKYGEGGEAIYAADIAELVRIKLNLK